LTLFFTTVNIVLKNQFFVFLTQEIKVNDEVYGMDRTEDNVRQLEDEWSEQRARYLGKGALLPGVDTPLTLGANHSSRYNPTRYDPSCDNPRLLPN
jgi:hypothetical protein